MNPIKAVLRGVVLGALGILVVFVSARFEAARSETLERVVDYERGHSIATVSDVVIEPTEDGLRVSWVDPRDPDLLAVYVAWTDLAGVRTTRRLDPGTERTRIAGLVAGEVYELSIVGVSTDYDFLRRFTATVRAPL